MDKPLHRPIMQALESPASVLIRICEYNGWQSPTSFLSAHIKEIIHSKDSLVTFFTDKKKWRSICEQLGITTNSTNSTCYDAHGMAKSYVIFSGLTLYREHLRLKHPAICPSCLDRENNYTYQNWDLKLITCCIEHQTELVSICPSCNNKLSWNRPGIKRCICGYDLSTITSPSVNTESTKFIEQLVKDKKSYALDILLELNILVKNLFFSSSIDISDYETIQISTQLYNKEKETINRLRAEVEEIYKKLTIHPRYTLQHFLISECPLINDIAITILDNDFYDVIIIESNVTELETVGFDLAGAILGIKRKQLSELINNKVLKAIAYFCQL